MKSGTNAPVPAPVAAAAPARVNGLDATAEYAAAFEKAGTKNPEGTQKLKAYKFILVSGLFSNLDKSKLPLAKKKPAAKPKPHFAEQIAWLKSIGAEYELLSMKSESSVQVNAAIISAAIKASDKPVMIVGSSKGGLDVLEALVAEQELAPKVRGVVMCQIPFLGTPVADYVMEHRGIAGPLSRFLERVGGSIDSMINLTTADRKAYLENNAAAVSSVISAVPIISVATWKDPSEKDQDTGLRPLRNWMLKQGLKNDGLVTVDSAILPGTDYIKIPGVDHGATIKKTKKIEFDRARFAEAVFMMLLARQAN
ncbi:MAG TPA: hypothetical protein DCZ92_06860 [Elusimicrobia bacterium]|nr:MAG: hypothetical protein A2016_05105 [Elusimicrobia bacterium GWF2_62_30]HBA60526.1 hypothetical protein [Elusimicrobiota bacterium]